MDKKPNKKITIVEALDRIEAVAIANSCSQILDQLICEEIEKIREEYSRD